MFNSILNRLAKKRRAIFRFFDGIQVRYIDPFEVIQSFDSDPDFVWSETPNELDLPNKQLALDAMRITSAAVCRAFGVADLDEYGDGLTKTEQLQLLIEFSGWVRVQKKSGRIWLPRSSSMDSGPPNKSMDDEHSETPDSNSDSIAIKTESLPSELCPFSLAPEHQLVKPSH